MSDAVTTVGPTGPSETSSVAPGRLPPRKLALRVSGARVGTTARPVADAALTGNTAAAPTHRLGLRIHSSPLVKPAPAAAPVAAPAPLTADDYARVEDYE